MYDINLRNVKKGRGFFAIFFIFGIVFLAAPLFSLIEPFIERSKLSASTLSLPIKETNQEEDYDNSFFYSVDGVLYECSSSLIFVVPEEKIIAITSSFISLVITVSFTSLAFTPATVKITIIKHKKTRSLFNFIKVLLILFTYTYIVN